MAFQFCIQELAGITPLVIITLIVQLYIPQDELLTVFRMANPEEMCVIYMKQCDLNWTIYIPDKKPAVKPVPAPKVRK